MATNINRRDWLKTSLLVTGALAIPSALQKVDAKPLLPLASGSPNVLTDAEIEQSILAEVAPVIKARLSANENPFGPSKKAKKAIAEAIDNSYRYAFSSLQQFADTIATKEGVSRNQVILGAGSGPLLLAAAMYFSKGGGPSSVQILHIITCPVMRKSLLLPNGLKCRLLLTISMTLMPWRKQLTALLLLFTCAIPTTRPELL